MSLKTEWVLSWIDATTRALENQKSALTELDKVIGDGDHGDNLARGFAAVEQKLSSLIVETPRQALRTTGVILLAAVGGAAGPLYGTAFLRAAKAIPKDALELGPQEVAMMLVKAAEGIAERGGAQPGDKTMLDAWYPAATNAAAAVAKGADVVEILQTAADAASKGADGTLSMAASKGRASLLGERSIGHKDPGAVSTALILAMAAASAAGIDGEARFSQPLASTREGAGMASETSDFAAPDFSATPIDESSNPETKDSSGEEPPPPEITTTTPKQASPEFDPFQSQAQSFQTAALRLLADDDTESAQI